MSEKQGRHTGHRHMGHGPMHGMGAGEKAKISKEHSKNCSII